jgi:hypothetical protein
LIERYDRHRNGMNWLGLGENRLFGEVR